MTEPTPPSEQDKTLKAVQDYARFEEVKEIAFDEYRALTGAAENDPALDFIFEGLKDSFNRIDMYNRDTDQHLYIDTEGLRQTIREVTEKRAGEPYQLGQAISHAIIAKDRALNTIERTEGATFAQSFHDQINNAPDVEVPPAMRVPDNAYLKEEIEKIERDETRARLNALCESVKTSGALTDEERSNTLVILEKFMKELSDSPRNSHLKKLTEEIQGIEETLAEKAAQPSTEKEVVVTEDVKPKPLAAKAPEDKAPVPEKTPKTVDSPATVTQSETAQENAERNGKNENKSKLAFEKKNSTYIGSVVVGTLAGLGLTFGKKRPAIDPATGQEIPQKPSWIKRILGLAVLGATAYVGVQAAKGKSWGEMELFRRQNKSNDTGLNK